MTTATRDARIFHLQHGRLEGEEEKETGGDGGELFSKRVDRTINEEGQGRCLAVWQLPPTWDGSGRRSGCCCCFSLAHYLYAYECTLGTDICSVTMRFDGRYASKRERGGGIIRVHHLADAADRCRSALNPLSLTNFGFYAAWSGRGTRIEK